MFKKWIALTAAVLLTVSGLNFGGVSYATNNPQTPPPPPEKMTAFIDVPANHYASEAIKTMSSLGIITGIRIGRLNRKHRSVGLNSQP